MSPLEPPHPVIGYYASVRDTNLTPRPLPETGSIILKGTNGLDDLTLEARRLYQEQEAAFRAIGSPEKPVRKNPDHAEYYKARDSYTSLKATFPAATFSGTFQDRTDATLLIHTGLIGVDLDHLGRAGLDAESVRAACAEHPFTAVAFISPSGDGVKGFALVSPVPKTDAEHRTAWEQVAAAYKEVAPVDVSDPSSKNPSRLCFLSHDPRAVFKPLAEVKPLTVALSAAKEPPPQLAQSAKPATAAPMSTGPTENIFEAFLRHPDIVKQPPDGSGEAVAWCPWHPDRAGGHPSLGINTKKKTVRCFSGACGKGGIKALATAWGVDSDISPDARREIECTYDYHGADGKVRFQVVRYRIEPGESKKILQRRPHPEDPDAWVWNLKGVQPVLYRLPQLKGADKSQWVWVVEGEKDADRLNDAGLLATTNPMGAGKWRASFAKEFRGRLVAVIPDNDDAGAAHADDIINSVLPVANVVKLVRLPGAPDKGDVSDWLDAGHTVEELEESLGRIQALADDDVEEQEMLDIRPTWRINSMLPDAVQVTGLLGTHGYFVNGGADAWFFDRQDHRLVFLEKEDRDLRIMLGERYSLNKQDPFYSYLLEHMVREAHTRGEHAIVRKFSYYDKETNVVLLDMGAGRVLRISADSMEVRDNGADGVLFMPVMDHAPWEYRSDAPWRLLYDRVVKQVNFTEEESELTVKHQQTLLLLWLVSLAFDSIMPTKIVVMAIGPGESGKTSFIRSCGRILMGPEFDVDSLLQGEKGEEDFWINVTHSFFVGYDNVDQIVRWLPDALAQVATGIRRSKRQLRTTDQLYRTRISCSLAVTARTPTVSLTREDVAGRTLILHLKRIPSKKPEYEIQEEIATFRDLLMSDYAAMVQRALRVPINSVIIPDPGMRMADFARVATRIGHGLGEEMAAMTDDALTMVRLSQNRFATEEDVLTTLLGLWILRYKSEPEWTMDVGRVTNHGRKVTTQELYQELMALAKEFNMRFRPTTPETLGRQIKNMMDVLSRRFAISHFHTNKGNAWVFELKGDDEGENNQDGET